MHSLAIILVNYNGLDDTVDCIKSLQESDYPVKIYVVDNASKEDETIQLAKLFSDVSFIRSEQNLGFAGGNNLAIKVALEKKFDYIALLNNDTIVLKDTFKNLMDLADEETVVAPVMNYYSHPREAWFSGGFINRWTGNAKHLRDEISSAYLNISFATGCCFIAHRSIWEKTGLLDDEYFMYNEDEDFCVRLMLNDFKIKVVKNALIYHKVGKSCGGEISRFQIYYMSRNRIRVIRKFPHYFHWTALPFTIITRFLWMVKFLIQRKKDWIFFYRGVRDGIKGVGGKVVL